MTNTHNSTAFPTSQPTEHAMRVVWGQFAQEIGLLDHLADIPIPQKVGKHTAAAKLAALLIGLLSGIEFLQDLSHAPTPFYHDPALPSAGGLTALPEASAISRTLATSTPQSLTALVERRRGGGAGGRVF